MNTTEERLRQLLEELSPRGIARLWVVVTRRRLEGDPSAADANSADEADLQIAMRTLDEAGRAHVREVTSLATDAVARALSGAPALPLLAMLEAAHLDAAESWALLADALDVLVELEPLVAAAADVAAGRGDGLDSSPAPPTHRSLSSAAPSLFRARAQQSREVAALAANARVEMVTTVAVARDAAMARADGIDPLPRDVAALFDAQARATTLPELLRALSALPSDADKGAHSGTAGALV